MNPAFGVPGIPTNLHCQWQEDSFLLIDISVFFISLKYDNMCGMRSHEIKINSGRFRVRDWKQLHMNNSATLSLTAYPKFSIFQSIFPPLPHLQRTLLKKLLKNLSLMGWLTSILFKVYLYMYYVFKLFRKKVIIAVEDF